MALSREELTVTSISWWPFRHKKTPLIALLLCLLTWISTFTKTPTTVHESVYPLGPEVYNLSHIEKGFWQLSFRRLEQVTPIEFQNLVIHSIPYPLRQNARSVIRSVLKYAEIFQMDPFWILAIMWTESHFRTQVVSSKGAVGLMQILPGTGLDAAKMYAEKFKVAPFFEIPFKKDYLINPLQLSHEKINIHLGITYLNWLSDFFDGNLKYATVAYNMGPYWVKRRLHRSLPVAVKNRYLDKVKNNYRALTKSFRKQTRPIYYYHVMNWVSPDMHRKLPPRYMRLYHKVLRPYQKNNQIFANYVHYPLSQPRLFVLKNPKVQWFAPLAVNKRENQSYNLF